MNDYNRKVCSKMIRAAETGGQIYGNGRYNDVKKPTIGKEVTLTLGAYQFYGNEGRDLLKMIKEADPNEFKRYITDDSVLDKDWVDIKFSGTVIDRYLIGDLISTKIGIQMQDHFFYDIRLSKYIKCAESFGVYDDHAQMMWAEIQHLGGLDAVKRIFTKCNKNYSLDNIMKVLMADQGDSSSDNQVGDTLYWSRHTFCKKCIEQYAHDEFNGVYVFVE